MPEEVIEELRDSHQFLGDKLKGAGIDWSPEEALDEWRRLHPATQTLQEVAAIREAFDDVANGDRGIPFDEFDCDFKKRHNLPAKR
jgi:hypothetical protein